MGSVTCSINRSNQLNETTEIDSADRPVGHRYDQVTSEQTKVYYTTPTANPIKIKRCQHFNVTGVNLQLNQCQNNEI